MYSFITFLTSSIITFLIMPRLIGLAKSQEMLAIPNLRSSHANLIPTAGGVAIIIGIVFSILIWSPKANETNLLSILTAFSSIFLLGLVDDLRGTKPSTKLLIQMFVAFSLVAVGFRIEQLHVTFGIQELPFWVSSLGTVVFIVFTINAYNLIDGINGLMGSLVIQVAILLGLWFFQIEDQLFAIIAFSIAGSVLAFLWFNFSPAKIFMGDSGSLLLGLTVALLTIRFLETPLELYHSYWAASRMPFIALSLSFIPIFDALRVALIRIKKGIHPFQADKRHIHHLFLSNGFSHNQTTLILVSINFFALVIILLLPEFSVSWGLLVLVLAFGCLTHYLSLRRRFVQ